MRDAFGGVFTMRLMIVFIFILVAFTAVSLNYAKAFRIKNKIIDFIEQQQITDIETYYNSASSNISKIDQILSAANYNKQCKNGNGINNIPLGPTVLCYKGIVIEQVETVNDVVHYNVKTYADWNVSTLNLILKLSNDNADTSYVIGGSWEIVGEAKVFKGK